jgi:hypothetical protein
MWRRERRERRRRYRAGGGRGGESERDFQTLASNRADIKTFDALRSQWKIGGLHAWRKLIPRATPRTIRRRSSPSRDIVKLLTKSQRLQKSDSGCVLFWYVIVLDFKSLYHYCS